VSAIGTPLSANTRTMKSECQYRQQNVRHHSHRNCAYHASCGYRFPRPACRFRTRQARAGGNIHSGVGVPCEELEDLPRPVRTARAGRVDQGIGRRVTLVASTSRILDPRIKQRGKGVSPSQGRQVLKASRVFKL